MICRQCARRLAQQSINHAGAPKSRSTALSITRPSQRLASTIASDHVETNNPRPNDHPAATSTSAAQPFTAGTIPQADIVSRAPNAPRERSSVAEGMVLKGINFMKTQQDPIAMADEQYPEWLWRTLDKKVSEGMDGDSGDLFCKSSAGAVGAH